MRRWGWGQWRCPSEGHGRECGLRPSVQSGVPRCGALSPSLYLSLSLSLCLSPLPLLLTHSLTHSLRFPALSDTTPPPVPLPAFVRRRYLSSRIALFLLLSPSLYLSPVVRRGAVRHGRLQECTKCTVLTDARPCSTASTCLLRPFSFASPRSSSLSPPSCCPGLPLSLFLSFTPFLSFAVLHYFFSSIDYSASAGHSHILYIVLPPPPPHCHSREQSASLPACDASSPRPRCRILRMYVRAYRTQKKHIVLVEYRVIHCNARVLTMFVLAPSRYFFFPSFFLSLPS